MKRGSRKASTKRMRREDGAIEPELLKSQIAILSGGADITGNPLVTIPVKAISDRSQQLFDLDGACRYMVYLHDVIFLILKKNSAAFLVNLRKGCDEGTIIDVVKALEHLEIERRGAVSILYVVKPKSRSKTKLLKKLLGLTPPKKDTVHFTNQFKTMMVKSTNDLYTQIDLKDLTTEFGGSLVYDHDAWMYLHKKILPTLAQSEDVRDRLCDVKDKALLMTEYDTFGQTADLLKILHTELRDQYSSLIRHSDIELTIEKCKQTLHHLDDPEEDSLISKVHPGLLTQIITQIRNAFTDLSTIHVELEAIWKSVDDGLRREINLKEKKEEADKLCMEITERYWPLMTQHPNIGTNLGQAELYRTHFKSLLYDPGKEIVSDATSILETLQRMNVHDKVANVDVKTIVERLTNTIHPFALQLNDINQMYVEMHVFFLVFEKALVWYKKAIDLIPTSLCSRAANGDSSTLSLPTGWRTTVQSFLRKHPAPRDDHIAHIDVNIPDVVDRITVKQAQLLADRLRLIITVLRNNRMEANLLRHIYDWKIERMSNTGDLNLTDDDDDTSSHDNLLQHSDQRYPGKRRITRHNLVRSRFNRRDGGSVMESRKAPRHETLRRTSSADTDKHIGNNDVGYSLSQSKCKSEFSLNNQPKRTHHDNLDNVVEFIQKLTSSRSMTSDKKLQYVSELLLNLDINDTPVVSQKTPRRRYSPSAKIIRKISRKTSATDKKPSEEIYDLNRRLCRSLDNILDIDLGSSGQGGTHDHNDKTKSMLHIPNSHNHRDHRCEDKILYETNEMSSRESLDSVETDEGSSRFISQSDDTLNDRISPPPAPSYNDDVHTHSEILNLPSNSSRSFVIFHKHSRERSIDCTPLMSNSQEKSSNGKPPNDPNDNFQCTPLTSTSQEKSSDGKSSRDPNDNFQRKSVTRIASIYKKRKSWNSPNKEPTQENNEGDDNIHDSEFTSLNQANGPAQSDITKYQRFPELDFSCGIFGSAPRKSMLSMSTDLGYDSQQDHAQYDDVITKETAGRTVSGGNPRGRRHSITCGTSALRLRRTSSNELDCQNKCNILNSGESFKEYKV